jgi:hypothetical protein
MPSTSLSALPPELILRILEYVEDSSRSVRALALTSRQFNRAAKPLQHRRKVILLTPTPGDFPETSLQDEFILRATRQLTVRYKGPFSSELDVGIRVDTGQLDLLARFIESLRKLEVLKWECIMQIPMSIIDAIHQHPKASLRLMYVRAHQDRDHNDPVELALARSPALTSISMSYWKSRGVDLRRVAFQRIVSQAPNLREAYFSAGASTGCLIIIPYPRHLQAEQESHFTAGMSPSSSVRTLCLKGFALNPWDFDEWEQCVQLDRLERFNHELHRPDAAYLAVAAEKFPKLDEVAFNLEHPDLGGNYIGTDVPLYLAHCRSLRSLTLHAWRGVLLLSTVLARHGPTLQKLELNEREQVRTERKGLSLDELKLIRDNCPNLTSLGIDMNRLSSNPQVAEHSKFFEILASLCLESVVLYLTVGLNWLYPRISDGEPALEPSSPSVIQSFTVEGWKTMFRDAAPRVMRRLKIHAGSRMGHDTGGRRRSLEIPFRGWCMAEWDERDDWPYNCIVTFGGLLFSDKTKGIWEAPPEQRRNASTKFLREWDYTW